jgi:hypothetical protein
VSANEPVEKPADTARVLLDGREVIHGEVAASNCTGFRVMSRPTLCSRLLILTLPDLRPVSVNLQ